MIIPVILAGGLGSRLWPLSRAGHPKQLLPLVNKTSLLQDTILRTQSLPDAAPPLVVCNEAHRFLVSEQLRQINAAGATILLEPAARNTAPAAAIAALYLQQNLQSDCTLLILPADHLIQEEEKFKNAVIAAYSYALQKKLVTFGIKPTHAETGYGYIKAAIMDNAEAYSVIEFIEKPNQEKATEYLGSGEYYWNSGMFMFQASEFLSELKLYAPAILETSQKAVANITNDLDFMLIDKKIFMKCPSDSIDYAVMEKTQHAVLVPLDAAWSDVGSWSALWEAKKPDEQGNVLQGDVITDRVNNSYLRAESRMLAVVGVKDHIVVETADAVLVAHKDHCQDVKNIVEHLKQKKRVETDLHRKVYRPWGWYETLDQGKSFQVKRITVKPGASLSLQMHHHRSEHWVVIKGAGEVTRGEVIFKIEVNQSTYIPQGIKHRLANPGEVPLEIIEVQSGDYLGEDDIVRFEDVYGR